MSSQKLTALTLNTQIQNSQCLLLNHPNILEKEVDHPSQDN